MQKIGTVRSIWRYPVKGMAGENIQQARLSDTGVEGDRLWAVRDSMREEIQSCKFRPALLRCQAHYKIQPDNGNSPAVEIKLPGGLTTCNTDPDVHSHISALLGKKSTLESLQPFSQHPEFYRRHKADAHTWLNELKATFAREPGEPLPALDQLPEVMQEFVVVPGTFFLVAPVHILTTASLNHMRELQPDADWAEERFRPNIVIETNPESKGLLEQQWIGKHLRIGNIEIDCQAPAPRCGAISQPQQNLPFDSTMLRSVVRDAEQNLGIYGNTVTPGLVTAGEEVFLCE